MGSSYCIMAVKHTKALPHYIMDMLKELSTVPEWTLELKRSACRQGAVHALAHAKAYLPELDRSGCYENNTLQLGVVTPVSDAIRSGLIGGC